MSEVEENKSTLSENRKIGKGDQKRIIVRLTY